MRDEKASLRSLREAVDKIEHNTIAALVDSKSAVAANKQAIDQLQAQTQSVLSDQQQIHATLRTQADTIKAVEASFRKQREDLVEFESTYLFVTLLCFICFLLFFVT